MASQPDLRSQRVATVVIATGIYWLVLFVATHIPIPGNWPLHPPHVKAIDKVQHIVAYAGLALLLCATGRSRLPLRLVYPAVLGTITLYGAIDELTQSLIPSRYCDFNDWLADVIGGVGGSTTFVVMSWIAGAFMRQRQVGKGV